MKKLVALFLVALILISAPVAIAIQFPRQVDPATAPSDPVYGQGLYLFYGSVVAAISGGNFSGAKALLHVAPFIHIPSDILSAVDTFNGLVNSTAGHFLVIDSQLDNASTYLETGRVALARANLTAAVAGLRSVNQTLTQLFAAAPALASLTGIPSSLFLQKLQPLEVQYSGYSAEANRLLVVLTGLTKLEPTAVTLGVGQRSFEVGSNVTVSGSLSAGSVPLAGRTVTVYLGGSPVGNATTGSSGLYSAVLSTPLYYRANATMFASFVPSGADSLVYAPATSAAVSVHIEFATPTPYVTLPHRAYAGQPMGVNGTLTVGGLPVGGYTVSMSGFSTSPLGPEEVATGVTSADGSFSLSITPPSSLSGGTYALTLATPSNGTVGPLSYPFDVNVTKESVQVTSSAPTVAIAGLPVTVSGTALVGGLALSGAQVLNTTPSPGVDTNTSASGSFSFTVTPPLTTSNGAWTYSLGVYPSQTWISSAPVSVTVFVINPLVLVFPASSAGMLLLVVRRRRSAGQGLALAPLEEEDEPRAAQTPRPPLTGLPAVYYRAAELAEKATGVPLLPHMTVREYLGALLGKLKGFEHFRTISSLLERHLYAGARDPGDQGRAEAELEAMRREDEA